MGEEVDAALIKKVKQTQEVLSNFIRRPPLTEKHLIKPPFRFIHDIVMAVIDSTGFLYGLYEGAELDASSITTRETKTAWMQKLVEALKLTTGEEVDVKISKILAGQEPAKTNDLLICLGNALSKNLNSDKAVQQINGKELISTNKQKPSTDTKDKKKNTAAAAAKLKEQSPYSTSNANKKPTKAPSKAGNDDKAKARSKPGDAAANKGPAKDKSKAALSSSPPKGAGMKSQGRQGSSDRLLPNSQKATGNKAASGSTEKPPSSSSSKQSSSNLAADKKGSARPSGSIDETGPPSLGEGDAGNDNEIVGHTSAVGSRRGSMSTASSAVQKEAREASKYGRQQQQQQSRGGAPEDPNSLSTRPAGAFASPEAHADDDAQAQALGELDFLLKKHGYESKTGTNDDDDDDEDETNGHQLDGHGSQLVLDDDDDDENANTIANDTIEGEGKTDSRNNNNIPGSAIKESLSRKSSNDHTAAMTGKGEESELLDNNNEPTIESISPPVLPPPTPMPPPIKRNSAARSRSSSKTSSHDVSPSTSALSVTNAVLGPLSPSRMTSAKPLLPDINERPTTMRPPSARPHTSQMRPGGPTAIARPPSARPAPPRPKTALIPEKEENTFRPTTAKVANVLLDSEEPNDDDNYIVHEVAPPSEPPSGELEDLKTAELGLHGQLNVEENIDSILDPDQRGLLVNQMLDAQNKLGDGSRLNAKKTDIERDAVMGDKDRMRMREVTAAEVEKLKNLMQLMARNANPLGKLMDFVQEDVDAMQRDLIKWREESRKLDAALEAAQEETEQSLEPLRRKMAELDESIHDRLDAIAATKMTIFRQEERIKKVLMGLDRVKVRTGHEPKITSADLKNLVESDGNFDFNDNNKVYFKKNVSSPIP